MHNLIGAILVLLASVSLVTTSLAAWAHQTVLSSNRFVAIVTDVTSDPQVIDAVSEGLALQVVDRLEVQMRLEGLLPDRLDRLAVPVTEAVQTRLADSAEQLLASDEFQQGWETEINALHSGLIAVLRGEAENVQLVDGALTIDLLGITSKILAQLQADGVIDIGITLPDFEAAADRSDFIARLGEALDARIPDDFGTVTIANATGFDRLSTLVRQFDLAVVGLGVLSVLFLVLAVWWADRHLRGLLAVAVVSVALIALLWLGLFFVQGAATDSLAAGNRPLISGLVASLVESLVAWLLGTAIVIGAVGLVAALFGRPSGAEKEM